MDHYKKNHDKVLALLPKEAALEKEFETLEYLNKPRKGVKTKLLKISNRIYELVDCMAQEGEEEFSKAVYRFKFDGGVADMVGAQIDEIKFQGE